MLVVKILMLHGRLHRIGELAEMRRRHSPSA